jgi:CheY-like chemotaxis protein
MFMPVMDGQTATRQIRKFEEERGLPCVPVIAMTANRSEGYRKECLDAGCTEFMTKPIDYNLLVSLSKTLVKIQ